MKPKRMQRSPTIRGMLLVLGATTLCVACSDARETATGPSLEWENIWLATGGGGSGGTPGEDWPEFCEELFDANVIDECDFMMTSMRDSLLSVFDDTAFFRSDDLNCADLKTAMTDIMSFNDKRARGTGIAWAAVPVDTVTWTPLGVWIDDALMPAPADTIRITMGHDSYHVENPRDTIEAHAEAAGRYCFKYTDSIPPPWQPI